MRPFPKISSMPCHRRFDDRNYLDISAAVEGRFLKDPAQVLNQFHGNMLSWSSWSPNKKP